ncbi:MAG: ACP S-malonyltransferase [Bacteroidales bacterium]|nr:MAG: ACP S-malonyltransferase [Bacteroidales bacterium]
MKKGWLFPAFVTEYIGTEVRILDFLSSDFRDLLVIASEIAGKNLTDFEIRDCNFLDKEFENQCVSYVFSCAITDLLKRHNHSADYLSGLSMGIYAALYAGGSVSFEVGLQCVKKAYDLSINGLKDYSFGMAAVIGLTQEELEAIIRETGDNVRIVNTNGIHSFVISGVISEVETAAFKAHSEGAFHSGLMDVTCPYHTDYMHEIALAFQTYLKNHEINDSSIPIVSVIDQSMITSQEQIVNELARNLDTKINWYQTMLKLIHLGVGTFMECGAGKSLYKIGRFIEGEFKIVHINKLPAYINRFIKA